jgi:outer membrane receptor protein involved in Fe transport
MEMESKKWMINVMLLALVGGLPAVCFAAEKETAQLSEIVVTASKAPKTAGNVTQKVTIIHREQIESTVIGRGNIAELLIYEPGVFVSPLSRNDANWGSSGGLSQKYNTCMLDGMPIDAFVEPQSLDPLAFQRIELQRGPAAVLYPNYLSMDFSGNQSPLTGTTNLILKERIDTSQTELDAFYGSYNTYGAKFYHQQNAGDLHLFFGGRHEASDYTDYGSEGSWLNMIDDPEYEKTKLYLKTTLFLGDSDDHKMSLFVNQTGHTGDTGRPNRDFDHQYQTVNAAYALPLSNDVAANLKVGYRHYDRAWEQDNYPADLSLASENGVEQYIIPADISVTVQQGENNLLTVGADYQSADYETWSETDRKRVGNDAQAQQYAIYFQEELALDSFIVRLGGRYAHTEHDIKLLSGSEPGDKGDSWDKFLWSAGVRYHANDKLSFYTNAGTSFVAPSLKSVGGTIALSDLGVAGRDGHLPNPDLEPEEGIGSDLGVHWQPAARLKLGARGFYNIIDDQIVQIVVTQNPSQSQDINAGDTTSYGVALELRHDFLDWLGWFANYTYTHTEISNDNDPDQDGAQVPFVPEHMGNIGMDLRLPYNMTASVYLHLAGEIYDSSSKQNRTGFDSYELLNASIKKRVVDSQSYRLDGYVELYNITDNQFKMPWQFQDPGFSALVGFKLVI